LVSIFTFGLYSRVEKNIHQSKNYSFHLIKHIPEIAVIIRKGVFNEEKKKNKSQKKKYYIAKKKY